MDVKPISNLKMELKKWTISDYVLGWRYILGSITNIDQCLYKTIWSLSLICHRGWLWKTIYQEDILIVLVMFRTMLDASLFVHWNISQFMRIFFFWRTYNHDNFHQTSPVLWKVKEISTYWCMYSSYCFVSVICLGLTGVNRCARQGVCKNFLCCFCLQHRQMSIIVVSVLHVSAKEGCTIVIVIIFIILVFFLFMLVVVFTWSTSLYT